MANRASAVVLLLLTLLINFRGVVSIRTQGTPVFEQGQRPARALLGVEEDYAHAVGATKHKYRLLSGTWFDFKSAAGGEGEEMCAKARGAVACSRRPGDYETVGGRDWDERSRKHAL